MGKPPEVVYTAEWGSIRQGARGAEILLGGVLRTERRWALREEAKQSRFGPNEIGQCESPLEAPR
jgi:hypothetical protein